MRIVCPHCALELNEHVLARHVDKARCRARREAALLYARGLHPVELRYQAKSDHVAAALGLFGHVVELHRTRGRISGDDAGYSRRGGSAGDEVWTSTDGGALARIVEEAARLLTVSYPEAARRLHERQDLIGPFGTAWGLAPRRSGRAPLSVQAVRKILAEDDALCAILHPIAYVVGSDNKRRPRSRG